MSVPAESAQPNLLPAALAYVNRFRWPVFPVHGIAHGHCTCGKPDCSRPGKHPIGKLVPRGLLDATLDPEQVAAWWREAPYANIGVPTGQPSGLVVLDVDVHKAGDDSLWDLQQRFEPLPATAMALTGGGGFHYLFEHPGVKVRNSVDSLGPGLDVRGDGGYIIVAPSSHASGRRYEWELSCHPKDTQLAALPAWLLERIVDTPRPATPPPESDHGRLYPNEVARIKTALGYLDPEPYDGWLQVGMALHASGDDERGFALWIEWAGCSPKFDLADHQRRWASFQRRPGGVTLGSLFAAAKARGYAPAPPPPEPPPPPPEPPAGGPDDPSGDWEAWLSRNGRGEVITSPANLETIFQHHPAWKALLAYDAMSYRTVKRHPPPYPGGEAGEWSDADDTWTAIWMERKYGLRPRNAAVAAVAGATAQLQRFHQVTDWLESLPPWDGTERLPHFFADYCGAPLTPYTEAVGRAFFVAAVARVYRPGCKVDTMLVLEGGQGIGKSKLILALFGAKWHIEISYPPGSLDFYQALRGCWCAEFGELSAFDKADTTRIKQVLTQVQDTYRSSYGHHAGTYPRQTVFVGSTNKREWGVDETGMRRFLPIACHEINVEGAAAVREQLWAEARQRFKAGEDWWHIPDAEREQEARFDYDAWEEKVAAWIERRNRPGMDARFTVNDVYEGAIYGDSGRNMPPISRADQMRLGRTLTRLGWQRARTQANGQRQYFYERIPGR
ncbi:MAG: bifunctional DNA primase/polymerase [Chromatiaceae bacterium]|nr:bifunctional DNA primase/polymerase [Candidatus Thioaporhodococcus sediminis]